MAFFFLLAFCIMALPRTCINSRFCCQWFRQWMSRNLRCYCVIAMGLNLFLFCTFAINTPHVSVNQMFLQFMTVAGKICDHIADVCMDMALLAMVFFVVLFRNKIVVLLGVDQKLIRADLRDILTCFSMERFQVIEVAIWKVAKLPPGLGSRSLFVRMIMGYNEALHSRPHDGVHDDCNFCERFTLNYDPEDDTQCLTIVVKEQEVVSAAVSAMAPAAGAVVGGAVNAMTPLGVSGGALAGAVGMIGAANSIGVEVARVELSSAMINHQRRAAQASTVSSVSTRRGQGSQATRVRGCWNEDNFVKVDLVPEGELWLQITDVVSN